MALLGVVTLAGGYILALKADNVLTGLNTFFVAVLLVIIGTFALFTAGSIAFLKSCKETNATIIKQTILFQFPE